MQKNWDANERKQECKLPTQIKAKPLDRAQQDRIQQNILK